jgi:eukaryotic-like serine/threonine-protein kinase
MPDLFMLPSRLTCPCGHAWDYTGEAPPPSDLREICPMCSPVVDADAQTKVAATPSPSSDSQPGFILGPGNVIADYEVLHEINRGGMGVIYKAKQKGLDRIVALKVIAPQRLANREARRRFKQEVVTAAKLNHPNIVTVFQTDIDGPIPYLAMEFVPGIDLSKLVKSAGPLSPPDACYYMLQAAHGLQHAYEAGLVHRDIKPANLMVTPSPLEPDKTKTGKLPRLKILDMGLARVVTEADVHIPGDLTRDGIFLGTPDYVAPEQAEDARSSDIRADIYSLGSSLYFLLTGEIPFPGASVLQKLKRQANNPPPSPKAKRDEISQPLDMLVRRMMARNPLERPQTPAELIAMIEAVMRGSALHATALSDSMSGSTPFPVPPATKSLFAKAHENGLHSVAVTPDGATVLTGGADGRIKLWNAQKLKETREFQGDLGALEQVVLAPNGKWAASCSTRLTVPEMRVQLWDLSSGTEHGRGLKGAKDNYHCVAISPDGKRLAAGCGDHAVWVWSFEFAGIKPTPLKGHTGTVTAIAFARNADTLLSASADGTVRQWDLKTATDKGSLNATVGPVKCLAFANKRVAVGGKSLAVRRKTATFERLDGHNGPVNCVAFNEDGSRVASGGADGTVRIWHVDDGLELACLEGHAKPVHAVAFGPDGAIFSGGEDGTLRRWPSDV